jgi:carbonic anhydrase/acetyltransferase-like protein (isoleucine patch superfamily)
MNAFGAKLPWPKIDVSPAAFVAANATVIGQVTIGRKSSIWYNAVVRGDVCAIDIGEYSNIQDGAVIHGDPDLPTILESYVTIGHQATIHSAHLERGCLIGIGAIVLNGVRIGAGSIIGAGCVVTKDVLPRSMMVGVPAKLLREVTEAEVADLITHAEKYAQLATIHTEFHNLWLQDRNGHVKYLESDRDHS